MLITTGTLARLTRMAESAMPDSCTVKRATAVANNGDYTVPDATSSWTTVYSGKCRMQPMRLRPDEQTQVGGLEAITRFELHLPKTADILPRDRVVFGALDFEVNNVYDPRSYPYDIGALVTLVGG